MRNANVEQVGLIAPRGLRIGIIVAVLAVAAGGLIAALALDGPASAPETASLTRAQQAAADRLTGLAEAQSIAEVMRGREAEAARWQARGEHYRQSRAQQAEADRLTGLAERAAAEGLTRPQRAAADRLTGLAEHLGVTSP